VDAVSAPVPNRDKPLYRVFLSDNSDDASPWYRVENFRPTDLATARESALLRLLVGDPPWVVNPRPGVAPWADEFWRLTCINRKGTIYEPA
jgi:hypothetical protein